ncbi:L,D-transpeptidase [Labrys sp. KNU-23]|uniref:L,D-transpeptidase n=1 Tax=Labrys sp. KNU-23 TaxID=2789216 RepID=UPI00165A3714|nr:L,D-transpeptidase [Labrys sp. KNU-23]
MVVVSLILGGCVTGSGSAAPMAEVSPRATKERFPVRLINRARFPADFAVTEVDYPSQEPAGTVVVQTWNSKLYFIMGKGKARRYAVAVGKAGHGWKGSAVIQRRSEWPAWHPTDEMLSTAPSMPQKIPPGPDNPLGARALYLYADGKDTLYRIHGTSEPWTIGTPASSGCIRMFNEDVIDLYARVDLNAKVIVQ